MKRASLVAAVSALIAIWSASTPAQAPQLEIRMATPVPKGTIWDKSLNMMGAQWKKATNDRLNLIVHPLGGYGDDDSVVRQMRFDDPQAAALTAIGLSRIDKAFSALGLPFFYDSYDELNYVVEALTPELKKRAASKGFVLLAWTHTGWAYLFSKSKVSSVDDLKKLKLFTSLGDEEMVQWYRKHGFQPQALSYSEIGTSLSSGMIAAMPVPPAAANAFNWWKSAPYMVNAAIAPVAGAVVMTQKTFNRIAEADRAVVLEAARRLESEVRAAVPAFEKSSIEAMQKKGLTVTNVEAGQWKGPLQSVTTSLRGSMVPEDMFDLALKARNEYRAKQGAKH
jgi:TRAP-type transport system periplasmic protein